MAERIVPRVALLSVVAGLAALSGCGRSDRLPLTPAVGRVSWQGKPLAGALVVLVPLGAGGTEPVRPSAVSGDDGRFTLATYARSDGAPAGEYAVAVTWRGPQQAADQGTDQHVQGLTAAPDYFRGRYADPKTSGLRLKIEPGAGELPAIILN
jgi:hypothetical protein